MTLKICKTCHEEKLLNNFNKDRSKQDKHSNYCKICTRKRVNKHYRENPLYYETLREDNNSQVYIRNRDFINNYKLDKKCLLCEETYPRALDFHHIVEQSFKISDSKNLRKSIATIEQEIAKCILLCSNCHRKLHNNGLELLPDIINNVIQKYKAAYVFQSICL